MSEIGNYARHAAVWDWGGYDRGAEFEARCRSAAKYGSHVLLPFCALGECGAHMARRGFDVTAFDLTPEMIEEGKKRFGTVPNLRLFVGDVRDFYFPGLQADFCFVAGDFGHIHTLVEVKKALACIGAQLREGGRLLIEAGLPVGESAYSPPKSFYPKDSVYPDKKVWKIGDTRNDAETGRCHISQTVFVENADGSTEQFDHSFTLQSYSRGEWLSSLAECGFEIGPCVEKDGVLTVEATKKRTVPPAESEVLYLLRTRPDAPCGARCAWLTAGDGEKFNEHLLLCGKKPCDEEAFREWHASGTAFYCLLYADGLPVARGAIEPYSEGMWEAADIYVAREYRGRGFAKELLRFIVPEIVSRAKIASCRTERDNVAMRRAMEAVGFYPDGGGAKTSD